MPPVMRPMTAAERRRAPSAAREANLRAMQARPMSARGPPARSTAAPPARFSASQPPVDISYEENYAAPPPLLPPPPIAPTAVVERVAEAETILVEMRTALKQPAVGPDSGLAGLARNFRLRDSRQSKRLELNEFAECVALCKLGLSAEKIGKLFSRFDVDGSGTIDYVEFLQSVRGPLSAARKKVVIQAFHALDAMGHGDGLIALDLLHEHYDAHKHPSVVSGRVDAGSALRSFVEGFGGETVALDDFLGYYEEVSASMATDDAFCSLVASTWGRLKVRGSDRPAVSFVPKKEVDALERLLFDASYRRKGGSAHSQERLINEAFKLFDVDGSGNVDCHEFLKAMERFGLHVRGKGKMGIGGLKESVVLALFDRYDKDASARSTSASSRLPFWAATRSWTRASRRTSSRRSHRPPTRRTTHGCATPSRSTITSSWPRGSHRACHAPGTRATCRRRLRCTAAKAAARARAAAPPSRWDGRHPRRASQPAGRRIRRLPSWLGALLSSLDVTDGLWQGLETQ